MIWFVLAAIVTVVVVLEINVRLRPPACDVCHDDGARVPGLRCRTCLRRRASR